MPPQQPSRTVTAASNELTTRRNDHAGRVQRLGKLIPRGDLHIGRFDPSFRLETPQ